MGYERSGPRLDTKVRFGKYRRKGTSLWCLMAGCAPRKCWSTIYDTYLDGCSPWYPPRQSSRNYQVHTSKYKLNFKEFGSSDRGTAEEVRATNLRDDEIGELSTGIGVEIRKSEPPRPADRLSPRQLPPPPNTERTRRRGFRFCTRTHMRCYRLPNPCYAYYQSCCVLR